MRLSAVARRAGVADEKTRAAGRAGLCSGQSARRQAFFRPGRSARHKTKDDEKAEGDEKTDAPSDRVGLGATHCVTSGRTGPRRPLLRGGLSPLPPPDRPRTS